MASMSDGRGRGAYKKNAKAIEEMVMAGISNRVIAETLGLKPAVVKARVHDWGLSAERELYHADLAKQIAAKHAND